MSFINTILFLTVIISSGWTKTYAQNAEWLQRNYEGQSTQESQTLAKKEIQEQGVLNISEALIRELIGDEKFQKNKSFIQNKIVKQSAKYIPVMKQGDVSGVPGAFKLKMEFKVSLQNLKQLLLENNLLNESDVDAVMLPLVAIQDSGRSYAWWMDTSSGGSIEGQTERPAFYVGLDRHFERTIRKAFFKRGFYVLKPTENNLAAFLPEQLNKEMAANQIFENERKEFSLSVQAPILVQGMIQIDSAQGSKYLIKIQLEVIRADTGRSIAQMLRNYETEKGNKETVIDRKLKSVLDPLMQELALQVQEAWQKGTVTASKLSLVIRGRFQPQFNERFKEKIRNQLTQVKNIYERKMGGDFIGFEIESSITAQELAQKIRMLDIDGIRFNSVTAESSDMIEAKIN